MDRTFFLCDIVGINVKKKFQIDKVEQRKDTVMYKTKTRWR